MNMSDTESRVYDDGHYPISGRNAEDDGRKRWAPIPLKARKEEALRLVELLLSGERKSQAIFWIKRRRYTPHQLENFIKAMECGLEARREQ